jgi:Protein of unknown function (DUF3306)
MSDGFFSRWSRRKQDAAAGRVLVEPVPDEGEIAPVYPAGMSPAHPPSLPQPPVLAQSPEPTQESPLPSLDDVQPLTPTSDFQPFMRQGVTPEVRNAAMKKLFTDPHFNVMDGLDIYIGDYTQPDPLPAGMLEQMVGAQLLNLMPPPEDRKEGHAGPVGTEENPDQSPQAQQAPAVVAQSPDSAAPSVATSTDHDHTDLQLQPDPAAADPQAGSSPR